MQGAPWGAAGAPHAEAADGGGGTECTAPPEAGPARARRVMYVISPFHGGAHRRLTEELCVCAEDAGFAVRVFTLPGRKWHWRMYASALHFAHVLPPAPEEREGCEAVLFVTSMTNLAELLALRPDLRSMTKLLYFHENQLTYPSREVAATTTTAAATTTTTTTSTPPNESAKHTRTNTSTEDGSKRINTHSSNSVDWYFPHAQIVSCAVADRVFFNSQFNQDSFLDTIDWHMRRIPEAAMRVMGLGAEGGGLRDKCRVVHFPVRLERPFATRACQGKDGEPENEEEKEQHQAAVPEIDETIPPLRICWNHRWEWDKGFEAFLRLLLELKHAGCTFELVVLGQSFAEVPEEVVQIRNQLQSQPSPPQPPSQPQAATAVETMPDSSAPRAEPPGPPEAAAQKNTSALRGLVGIVHWGFVEDRAEYNSWLASCDVCVSCAQHEFWGVSMVEAALLGVYALCPNRLAYPELFHATHLYNTDRQLLKRLRHFCRHPQLVRPKADPSAILKVDVARLQPDAWFEQLGIS